MWVDCCCNSGFHQFDLRFRLEDRPEIVSVQVTRWNEGRVAKKRKSQSRRQLSCSAFKHELEQRGLRWRGRVVYLLVWGLAYWFGDRKLNGLHKTIGA